MQSLLGALVLMLRREAKRARQRGCARAQVSEYSRCGPQGPSRRGCRAQPISTWKLRRSITGQVRSLTEDDSVQEASGL
ncbi:hypothetical protein NDU88_001000 [Pleurodeles waltl]|uniref:Uncharacterized protein n=1 Tax=Pleurodeles waltl TaxID=8319 RepID=A0AAV7WL75_PLEWA|nr:hypothetical protein NDU88_001000 [Pleurodeles waltl]